MVIVLRGLLLGALLGVLFGSLARALMRLVAIGMVMEPEFDLPASIALVSVFLIAGAGAGAARAVGPLTWPLALVLVLASAPLLVMGTVFAVGEIGEILERDLTMLWRAELLAFSGVILATVLVTPYTGWRAGRRVARRAGRD